MNEHRAMLECKHSEADQIGPICLSCGLVSFDPSWLFVGFAVFFFGLQAARFFL